MSTEALAKAAKVNRLYRFKDISVDAKSCSLVLHTIVEIQFLDRQGQVVLLHSKTRKKKFETNALLFVTAYYTFFLS